MYYNTKFYDTTLSGARGDRTSGFRTADTNTFYGMKLTITRAV
jgi:hypothetical protein